MYFLLLVCWITPCLHHSLYSQKGSQDSQTHQQSLWCEGNHFQESFKKGYFIFLNDYDLALMVTLIYFLFNIFRLIWTWERNWDWQASLLLRLMLNLLIFTLTGRRWNNIALSLSFLLEFYLHLSGKHPPRLFMTQLNLRLRNSHFVSVWVSYYICLFWFWFL